MKYLVTGGAGFIGSNIVKRLLELGEFVRIIDNFSTGRKENIEEFIGNPNFELIEGDITDLNICQKSIKDMDFVLHQAAIPSVNRSILDPKSTFEANAIGTLNLLIAVKKYKIKKIVYASSSSIYGPGHVPKKEEMTPNPISPYALSKFTGEKLCQIFSKIYGIPTICLRYFNVFGPRQNPFSEYAAVIPKFISAFLKNKRPVIYGDGKQTRDFTYVENVVEANLKASRSKFRGGEIFNIACGKQISLLDLINILNKYLFKNIKPLFRNERPGDIKHSFADISKAKKILGYTPKISFKDGLKMAIEWFKEYES
jgi:UDP-glucose 4-epimerase